MAMNFEANYSTNEIYRGQDTTRCLSDDLDNIEQGLENLAAGLASHESALEGLEDSKAEDVHYHEMSAITGLSAALTEMEEAISALQNSGGSAGVTPILVASMHLGKLDNNSGAENSSSTRICSDPFAVESGKSYYQVNDKGVNMYVLIYDAEEVFLEYLGNFASGAEIAVTNANAAYMRLGSLLGEYDLTNEFRIYDVDPASGESSAEAVDAYSKEEADERFAPIAHTHSGYAATDHTHEGYAASSHTHTAADITGLPSSVDAYSKTESDTRFAAASHTHDGYAAANHTHSDYMTENDAVDAFAGINHTHSGYAAENHTHDGYAASGHTHTPASIGAAALSHTHSGYASSGHNHTTSEVGAVPATGGEFTGNVTVSPYLYTAQIMPKDAGSYSIGSADNRYYSTYLRANPNVSSDKRLKRDIAALDAGTLAEFVNALPVVAYNYNDDAEDEAQRIGLIAQDVISANPEIARFFVEQSEKGFYSLRPADFVFPLIAAVQQLSARVAELERKK